MFPMRSMGPPAGGCKATQCSQAKCISMPYKQSGKALDRLCKVQASPVLIYKQCVALLPSRCSALGWAVGLLGRHHALRGCEAMLCVYAKHKLFN